MSDSPEARYERLVAEYGGGRVIRRVLIANNGMAATKFIISIRRWLHLTCGDARLVQLVGMATPDDIRANARHVSMADVIEEVRARLRTRHTRLAPTELLRWPRRALRAGSRGSRFKPAGPR